MLVAGRVCGTVWEVHDGWWNGMGVGATPTVREGRPQDYELQVSITSKCRSKCREASVAMQVSKQEVSRSKCFEASGAKQVSRSKCCEASVTKQVSRSKCCEASVARRGATCRAGKKRRNNPSPETNAFNRKTNGHVWLSQPKTTMCLLRTACVLLLLRVFRWAPIDKASNNATVKPNIRIVRCLPSL